MKQVLIYHSNQQSIADLQSHLAGSCYIYATSSRKMALEFLQNNPTDCLIIHLPSVFDQDMKKESHKLLKNLRQSTYDDLAKVIVCAPTEEQKVRDFFRMGVTAIVAEPRMLRQVLSETAQSTNSG